MGKLFGGNLWDNPAYGPTAKSDKKDPRLIILLKKIKTLAREVPRVPSLKEWEQCLHGIVRTNRKLSQFVQNTDHQQQQLKQQHEVEYHPPNIPGFGALAAATAAAAAPRHPTQTAMAPRVPPVILYDTVQRKKMHTDIFNLIQKALQSGPMAGSKPGKFHTGQEEVAVIAEVFLKQILDIGPIDRTNGQKKRLEKWYKGSQRRQKKSKKLWRKRDEMLNGKKEVVEGEGEGEEGEEEEEDVEEEDDVEEDFSTFAKR